MLNKHLDKVFELYKENYEKIFDVFYPAKNSTGFTEHNLSVNFCKAYETVFPESISWFEYQFGEKNNKHFDAIVVNVQKKELLIIESKRFSKPAKKICEIKKDIIRIKDTVVAHKEEFSRIPDFEKYTVWGVILADVWVESKGKQEIYNSFCSKTFIKQYAMPISEEVQYYISDFSDLGKYENCLDNYHLLSLVWKVK